MTHFVHEGKSPSSTSPGHMTFELRAAGESKERLAREGPGVRREEGEMEGERSGQMSPSGLHDSGQGHADFGLCELDAWEGLAAGQCQGSC